jgi:hypothetical protein
MQINELNSNELFITYCNLKDLKGINFDDFVSADGEILTEIVKSDIQIMSSNTHTISLFSFIIKYAYNKIKSTVPQNLL